MDCGLINVIDNQLMAGFEQISAHRLAHDSESYESDFAHMQGDLSFLTRTIMHSSAVGCTLVTD
jgi:hypothetical protein